MLREWTQEELGRRLGVSRQAINAIETGRYDPSLPLALRIGRLFGRPVEDIFLLEDPDSQMDKAPERWP
jgi:putative transcriptional regulator